MSPIAPLAKTNQNNQNQNQNLPEYYNVKPINPLEVFKQKTRPKLDYVFYGFKTKTIGIISSIGGVGKSMLGLQLAYSLADTICKYNLYPFVNENTVRGKVVYISLEDDYESINARMFDITTYINNKYLKNDADKTTFYNSITHTLDIRPLSGTNYNLLDNNGNLIKYAYDYLKSVSEGARLVIIDTFARLTNVDDSNQTVMSTLIKTLEKIAHENNTSFLLLHHQNKASAFTENDTQSSVRGSSVIVDNTRLTITMQKLPKKEAEKMGIEDEERGFYTKINFAKLNYAAPVPAFVMKKQEGGVLELYNNEVRHAFYTEADLNFRDNAININLSEFETVWVKKRKNIKIKKMVKKVRKNEW